MAKTVKTKKLEEAELVNQQVAPVPAQPADPNEVAQAQQEVATPVEPAGTTDPALPADTDPAGEISTPAEPQTPVSGMNDDGTFTPPAPGMVPVGWANPSDLAAAVAMATGDAEAAATAPDAQATEEPVVTPEGQEALADPNAVDPNADPNALTPEDQAMAESLTHADFELLREYKRYKEEQEEMDAIEMQNKVQDSAAKALKSFGTVTTAFKDAELHVESGAKCIVITSSTPLSKKDIEDKLNAAGYSLVSFLPGLDPEVEDQFLTKVIASTNTLEQPGLIWKDNAMKSPSKQNFQDQPKEDAMDITTDSLPSKFPGSDKAAPEKPEIDEPKEKAAKISESADGVDEISGDAGKEVAKEMDDLQDEAVQPAVKMNGLQEKKESLTESLKKLMREADEIPETPEDLENSDENLLGSEEADISGFLGDDSDIEDSDEALDYEVDADSLEADLAAIFDDVEEEDAEGEAADAVEVAQDVLETVADHLDDFVDSDEEADVEDPDFIEDTDAPEEDAFEDIDEDSEAEIAAEERRPDSLKEFLNNVNINPNITADIDAKDTAVGVGGSSAKSADKGKDVNELVERVNRIRVAAPEKPLTKQELPKRQQLKVRESKQVIYPAGSRPEDNLVEAYQNTIKSRHEAVAKFRESMIAARKPIASTKFTEALRTTIKTTPESSNPKSWQNNKFEEKAQRLEALDYKQLLRSGFLG